MLSEKTDKMAARAGQECTIMTFRPTWNEFQNFPKYVEDIERQGAHLAGIAKIIPPVEWVPRKAGYDLKDINRHIPAPIQQQMVGKCGHYQQLNIAKPAMSLAQFKALAESDRYRAPSTQGDDELERLFWRTLLFVSPYYGADSLGTLCDADLTTCNINRLGSILDLVEKDYGVKIDGVNSSFMYFGMWKAAFAWHTEDCDLYSINYIHFGAPKQWYAIPPSQGRRFEQVARTLYPESHNRCPAFLRHKMTMISPSILKRHLIPVNSIVQKEGEIIVTFPFGYHAGFNHGFNGAEATNFATPRWIEYGKRASKCECADDTVKISMRTFVKHFQPERYELWVKGQDVGAHPEEPKKIYAAPPPTEYGDGVMVDSSATNASTSEHKAKKTGAPKRKNEAPKANAKKAKNEGAEGQKASAIPKRKRGRPTKIAIAEMRSRTLAAEDVKNRRTSTNASTSKYKAKKTGAPKRKYELKNKAPKANGKKAKEEGATGQKASAIPKRKRGRPTKIAIAEKRSRTLAAEDVKNRRTSKRTRRLPAKLID